MSSKPFHAAPRPLRRLAPVLAVVGLSTACLSRDMEPMSAQAPAPDEVAAEAEEMKAGALDGLRGAGPGGGGSALPAAPPAASAPRLERKMAKKDKAALAFADDEADSAEGGGGEEAATRSWFPETFLFEPRLVTGDDGVARHSVVVPDRLTTWRVLGLAHARNGAQAGAVTSFLGTLPIYVDPVTPRQLAAGDRVRLPIQAVNTTEAPISAALSVSAEGASVSAPPPTLSVPARGSAVTSVELSTPRSGAAVLSVRLGKADAVRKSIPVRPTGMPVVIERSGTLAAPRAIELEGPAELDPESAAVRLVVFPGALAVLRSELSTVLGRGGVADDAYALLLAGDAPRLLAALGDTPDAEALRDLRLLATQRVLRHARAPDLAASVLMAEAALAHPDEPLLARLGERLAATVERQQRPDGTFGGATGWTVQRLLVATGEATLAAVSAADSKRGGEPSDAARRRAAAVRLRASLAVERYLARIDDPYTAAVVAASGAIDGGLKEKLRAIVREAVVEREDGSRAVPVPKDVVRSDGQTPTEAEVTAWAARALEGDAAAPWRADLGSTLLGAYRPGRGWGDGRSNLACLRAVLSLFDRPVPPGVTIVLELDGAELARGVLDATRIKDSLVLEAPTPRAAGKHRWTLRAEPAVPGLGYALALKAWVPWPTTKPEGGLELAVNPTGPAVVGRPLALELSATGPGGQPLELEIPLPAGVQPDTASLSAMVIDGALQRFDTEEGRVRLWTATRAPGSAFTGRLVVVPSLAGLLHPDAATIALSGRPGTRRFVAPKAWTIQAR